MATNYFKTDTQSLNRSITQFHEEIQGAVQGLDEMDTEIQALNAFWEGDAKQAFMIEYQKDMATMRKIIEAMQQIENDLNFAKQTYDNAEERVGSLIGNL